MRRNTAVRRAAGLLAFALACPAGRARAYTYVYTGHNASSIASEVTVDAAAFMPWRSIGSAKALGMGGAFTAVADDMGAVEYNPAGLGLISHGEATLTGVGVRSSEIDANGNKVEKWTGTPTFGGAGLKLGFLSVGASVRQPYFPVAYRTYGSVGFHGVTAPDGWRMRYDSVSNKLDATKLKNYALSGAVTLGPVSLGGNFNYIKGDVVHTIRGRASTASPLANSQFNAIDTAGFDGFTVDAGALVKLGFLRLGASARNVAGKVDVTEKFYWKDNYDMGSGNFFTYDPAAVKRSYNNLAPTYTASGALVFDKLFAADFDYEVVHFGGGLDKKTGRLGGELWVIPGFLAARGGLQSDFNNVTAIGDEKTQTYFLGAGLRLWVLEVDAAAALAQVKSGSGGKNFTGSGSATLRF